MTKPVLILFGGLVLGLAAYVCLYWTQTADARAIANSPHPELAWLKEEFRISDQEFARIRELHDAYLPECAAMCAKIAQANSEFERLVADTNRMTPEINAKLSEIGNLRQQCQSNMLSHFFAVSRAMPPEQSELYMSRMQKLTSLSNMRDHSVASHPNDGH
jgi:hypothetical protein